MAEPASYTLDSTVQEPVAAAMARGDFVTQPQLALSIVIVSWNTRELLRACLDSVFKDAAASHLAIEVFVVDNASSDGSVAMMEQAFPRVAIIANADNPGFAGANNQALACCKGQYALLLNPDTVVLPGALATLVSFMDAHADAGAAGARLLNADGSLQMSSYPQPTLLRELWRMFHLDRITPYAEYAMERWPVDQARIVDVVQGAALIVRQRVLAQVGGLDSAYFMYSEEVDWCHRIQHGGWRIYWAPTAAVIHYGGQSSKQAATAMFLQLYRAKIQYFRKHWGAFSTALYKIVLALATMARLLLTPFIWLEPEAKRARHRTLADQYWRLLRALPGM
jgi:GT2 family glycosyltransferase